MGHVVDCNTFPNSWQGWQNIPYMFIYNSVLNSLKPRRNRRHFADDIFKSMFLNENEWISLRFSLKFVNRVRINNIPSLVQIMTWRRPGDKPLSEPIMVSLLTHICVTRPQWVNQGPPGPSTSEHCNRICDNALLVLSWYIGFSKDSRHDYIPHYYLSLICSSVSNLHHQGSSFHLVS